MSITSPTSEPRFFFLMPVWGEKYVDFLLTFGLPTLLAENNLPWLPNRAQSEFIFLTTADDERRIRSSHLFGILESLVPVKFTLFNFFSGTRTEKFNQLGTTLKAGAEQAIGKGFCFFLHPDGLYSNGMIKYLYGLAKSGKKACVSHGPVVTEETVIPYLSEHGLHHFDGVNSIAPRALARILMDNLHPDMALHCLGNPHYPQNPYMGFWLAPHDDGALFRFVSLHPWMVDLSGISEISNFNAIDHNFIRQHNFIWFDEVHVETDSDNFLAVGIKPRNEMNARPSILINHNPDRCLGYALLQSSNCHYSRICFFHGMKVHTGDLDQSWRDFEATNLRRLNAITSIDRIFRNAEGSLYKYLKLFFMHAILDKEPLEACRLAKNTIRRIIFRTIRRSKYYSKKFFAYAFVERRAADAFIYALTILTQVLVPKWILNLMTKPNQSTFGRCEICPPNARRCAVITDSVTREVLLPSRSTPESPE